jgi:hypothetical protein
MAERVARSRLPMWVHLIVAALLAVLVAVGTQVLFGSAVRFVVLGGLSVLFIAIGAARMNRRSRRWKKVRNTVCDSTEFA